MGQAWESSSVKSRSAAATPSSRLLPNCEIDARLNAPLPSMTRAASAYMKARVNPAEALPANVGAQSRLTGGQHKLVGSPGIAEHPTGELPKIPVNNAWRPRTAIDHLGGDHELNIHSPPILGRFLDSGFHVTRVREKLGGGQSAIARQSACHHYQTLGRGFENARDQSVVIG